MTTKDLRQQIALRSGRTCQLLRIRNDLIPDYYLLTFPKTTAGEPTADEVAEMLQTGVSQAQRLALHAIGDAEAFSILYSGYSVRREAGWHIHIVLLSGRWKKAWLYFVLAGKNALQALGLRKDDAPRIPR